MESSFCIVKAPKACASSELEQYVSLVRAGGQVEPIGLMARVQRAHSLAFLRSGDELIGVAGLKFPSGNHRREVSSGAGFALSDAEFLFELGWVFVVPVARGGKSYALCKPLVAAGADSGVFATSQIGNKAMHATLAKLGFSRVGGSWLSGREPGNLWLFVRARDQVAGLSGQG